VSWDVGRESLGENFLELNASKTHDPRPGTHDPSPMTQDQKILLVDDETSHLETLERLFNKEGYDVETASQGDEALDLIRESDFELVISDLKMPELDGMELLELVQKISPETELIIMTAFGTVERAVEGIKAGAYDFISKPIKRAEILKSAEKALEKQALIAENRALKSELAKLKDEEVSIVGQSPALEQTLELARQVAPSDTTVLITGESGTGKELFARMIHEKSPRRAEAFVPVNCAALPENIIESELFGYEEGAFTGASERRIGRLESAHQGTVFLDEIGELSPQIQVKLLRFLQEETIQRLGSNESIEVDVRIVAATHKDLASEMETGAFREDLFYRLNVVNIDIPPLRERTEDIPLLVEHFLRAFADKNEQPIEGISKEAVSTLKAYDWPGNVRELENMIERAVVLDTDGFIDTDDLPSESGESGERQRYLTVPLGESLSDIEQRVIEETLEMTEGDKKLAAKLLGIAKRTIYRKLD
jgi:two-component system response regulator HydG